MLTTRAAGALLAFVAFSVSPLVSPAQAATGYGVCDGIDFCTLQAENPAVEGDAVANPATGLTPPPPKCYKNTDLAFQGEAQFDEIDCAAPEGFWSNSRQCYMTVIDGQPEKPNGRDNLGAWYNCTAHPECGNDSNFGCRGGPFWADTPPPGITRLIPRQAAAVLIRSFQLEGIDIGFAPTPDEPDSQSYVGIPIWMWVENQTPLSYGPYVETATLGGVTITATAKVTSILWNMGDGHTVACGDPGRPFKVEYGFIDSPTCGYRYGRMSSRVPGGRYPVTATSQWEVRWTGAGQEGVSRLTTTSETSVKIGELQSVNVTPGTRP